MGSHKVLVIVTLALLVVFGPVACAVLVVGSQGTNGGTGDGNYGTLDGAAIPRQDWVKWIEQAGSICPEITPPLIAAQIDAESQWNPNAVNKSSGAQGLAQFMPGTWSGIGKDADKNNVTSPFDPPDAIIAQGTYMCSLVKGIKQRKMSGDIIDLALAAYNAGPGHVYEYGGIPNFVETQIYVPKIKKLVSKYSQPGIFAGAPTGTAAAVIAIARSKIGTPYSWGGGGKFGPTYGIAQGTNIKGWDCSSFMQYVFWQGAKIDLPRVVADQQHMGVEVTKDQMRPGDMITFFGGQVDHVGLYIGGGQMIHSPSTGDHVRIQNIYIRYYQNKDWRIRRLIP